MTEPPSVPDFALPPVVLEARGVTKRFGGLTAVDGVNLAIRKGTIQGVIGPNGAGKTTFFNIVAGIYQPTEGAILFESAPIQGGPRGLFTSGSLRPDQIAARGIARTFQNIRLFANMTAIDNVMIGMHSKLKSGPVGAMLRLPSVNREERLARARARELLAYVGLPTVDTEFAKNLSYGDQRRLEIARALASEPRLLLLDEPTAGMNPNETARMTRFTRRPPAGPRGGDVDDSLQHRRGQGHWRGAPRAQGQAAWHRRAGAYPERFPRGLDGGAREEDVGRGD